MEHSPGCLELPTASVRSCNCVIGCQIHTFKVITVELFCTSESIYFLNLSKIFQNLCEKTELQLSFNSRTEVNEVTQSSPSHFGKVNSETRGEKHERFNMIF